MIDFDSYEKNNSKIGGMVGMEQAYDFSELLDCCSALNLFAAIEYGENGLKFEKAHNRMTNF